LRGKLILWKKEEARFSSKADDLFFGDSGATSSKEKNERKGKMFKKKLKSKKMNKIFDK